ncbi:MAG: FecR family protein [Bacteroidota bacterium]|nr:FecR family protein [Bacteroidota bacterium]MDP4213291.1 FecR family protein [Bacteroidota bacterium]MDP4250387.1 FecR family protein [Bacteroidota bacterium]
MNSSGRIATLLFLQSRNEISAEEENELNAWRAKSPEHEKLCRDLGDPEYVRKMMGDLYKERDIVYDGVKVRFSYLSDSKLSDADDLETDESRMDFPEKDIEESGLSRAAFWESLLSVLEFSITETGEDKGEQQRPKEAKVVSIKKRSLRRFIRVLAYTAAILLLLFAIDLFLPVSKYKNYEATMVTSDGVRTIFNDFYRGFKAGRAGIKFGETEKGEPIYIAANQHKAAKDKFYTLLTAAGGEFVLQLPDGTRIWLNAATTIKYPANMDQDTIRIEVDGEVYVERSKDVSHHFQISPAYAGSGGPVSGHRSSIFIEPSTVVNVNTYSGNDEMLLTLIRGAAGRQTLIAGDRLENTTDVNVTEIIAWKNGEFDYKETSLTTMMPAIARWYDVEVQYGAGIPDKKFSLRMSRSEPLSKLLDSLRNQGLHFTRMGRTITIWK